MYANSHSSSSRKLYWILSSQFRAVNTNAGKSWILCCTVIILFSLQIFGRTLFIINCMLNCRGYWKWTRSNDCFVISSFVVEEIKLQSWSNDLFTLESTFFWNVLLFLYFIWVAKFRHLSRNKNSVTCELLINITASYNGSPRVF